MGDKVLLPTLSTPATPAPAPLMTIAGTASNNPDLSSLVDALTTANLVDTLNDPAGNYTVFAPTNAAFTSIQSTVLGLPTAQLTNVLLAHVVQGKFLSTDLTDGQVVPTLFAGASVA